jgi:cytochrome c553
LLTRLFTVLVLTILAAPAYAQDAFDLEETVAACTGCHGENGVPAEADYPIIAGQQYFYLYTQLKDFSAKRRANDIMNNIAAEFTRDQMKEIAQYMSEQTWPAIDAEMLDGDEKLAELGITGGQCSACHGKWEGDSRIPRLAGQHAAYLEKQILDFKHDVRMNAPDLNSTMKQLDDATIAALSRYLATR